MPRSHFQVEWDVAYFVAVMGSTYQLRGLLVCGSYGMYEAIFQEKHR